MIVGKMLPYTEFKSVMTRYLMLIYLGVKCLVLHILLKHIAAFVFSNFSLIFL